jgi:hypothetical protein
LNPVGVNVESVMGERVRVAAQGAAVSVNQERMERMLFERGRGKG